MNKDQLLGELGDLARREGEAGQARLDERWDRLAAGTLTAEEEAELKALAASSPEAQEAYEAFRPLGADFQAGVVAKISQELRPRVLFFRRVIRRAEVWVGLAAAVAAGVFFFLRPPAALPPLPSYELASLEVPSEYRGPESGTATPGSPVTLKVRPQTAVTGKVEAHGFLSCGGGGDLRPWPLKPLNVTEKGIMTLQGTLGKDIQPGSSCKIWIVAARRGKAPDDLQAELRARRKGNADWQAVSTQLDVRLPP
ncbi:MAG: hypothetical protein ACJ76Y_12385 [Thermoanaerobaculia bacterium]